LILFLLGTGSRLAQAGFAVHGMDYEGHGKSSGLQGYITSFNDIVVDCSKYFSSVCGMYNIIDVITILSSIRTFHMLHHICKLFVMIPHDNHIL